MKNRQKANKIIIFTKITKDLVKNEFMYNSVSCILSKFNDFYSIDKP